MKLGSSLNHTIGGIVSLARGLPYGVRLIVELEGVVLQLAWVKVNDLRLYSFKDVVFSKHVVLSL